MCQLLPRHARHARHAWGTHHPASVFSPPRRVLLRTSPTRVFHGNGRRRGEGGGRVSGEACRTINSKKLESQLDLAGQAGQEEPPPKATYARPMPFSCRSRLFLSPISCTEERTVNIASSAMCPGLEMTHKNRRQCSSAGLPAYSSTSPEPVSGLHHASTPSASFLIPGDHSCHPIFLSGQRSLLPFRKEKVGACGSLDPIA